MDGRDCLLISRVKAVSLLHKWWPWLRTPICKALARFSHLASSKVLTPWFANPNAPCSHISSRSPLAHHKWCPWLRTPQPARIIQRPSSSSRSLTLDNTYAPETSLIRRPRYTMPLIPLWFTDQNAPYFNVNIINIGARAREWYNIHLFRDFDYSSAAGEELYLVILLYSLSCSFPASVTLSPAIFTVPWKQYKSSESPLQLLWQVFGQGGPVLSGGDPVLCLG